MPSSLVGTFRGHSHTVISLAVSADGRRLVSSSRDGPVRVWDANTGLAEPVLSRGWWRPAMWVAAMSADGPPGPVAFSRDGRLLYSGGDDDAIDRWDMGRTTSAAR